MVDINDRKRYEQNKEIVRFIM